MLNTREHRNTIIESLGVYLPPHEVSTREVLEGCRRRILFPLEMVTGIRSRRMAKGEYALDIAGRAVENCFSQSQYVARDIDLLICCNISRYDAPNSFTHEPSSALMLKKKFGLKCALSFDISNACAGVFTGLLVVDSFLKAGVIRRGMVVSGEQITHLTETAQRELKGFMDPRLACLTLGDSGIAMILEPGPDQKTGFVDMEIFTLGQHSRHCIAKPSNKPGGGAIMLTDVIKLSSVAISAATAHAVAVQKRAGWSPEELNHVIMHQTSERTIQEAMDRVNRLYGKKVCTASNTINNLRDRGNTASTSHFLAFHDHAVSGRILPGENVIFSVNASGLTIGTSAYVCDGLPTRLRAHAEGKPVAKDAEAVVDLPLRSNNGVGMRIKSIGVLPPLPLVRESTLEMSRAAVETCLEGMEGDRADIEVLIYAGVYRTEYLFEPATAALIAGESGIYDDSSLPPVKRTLCFDVLSGAAGLLKAFQVAACLMQSGRANRVLVVTSEIDSNALHPEKSSVGLDQTAAAVLLEAAPEKQGFGNFEFHDYTEHCGAFKSFCDLSVPDGVLEIHRDPRLEEIYLDCIETSVRDYLDGLGVPRSEIRFVLAPQISSSFLGRLGERIGFPTTAIVNAISGKGDLFTCSLPYAFRQLEKARTVQSGDLGLCLSVGAGIQVGCALYRF